MAKRKIVFVIVEGPSDDEALGILFSKIYDKNSVYVHIMHGDITTQSGVNSSNIVSKVENCVKQYATQNHYKFSDFKEIIHIVDMDGAYIPDSAVVYDSVAAKPIYSTTEIRSANPTGILNRNKIKRENIDRLKSTGLIWKLPYGIYYMSCNLDHLLYGKLNSSDEEKEDDAYAFAKKYRNDIPGFLEYIGESDFSVNSEYKESWKYITEGLHSLERHTNLGVCFQDSIAVNFHNKVQLK